MTTASKVSALIRSTLARVSPAAAAMARQREVYAVATAFALGKRGRELKEIRLAAALLDAHRDGLTMDLPKAAVTAMEEQEVRLADHFVRVAKERGIADARLAMKTAAPSEFEEAAVEALLSVEALVQPIGSA